MDNPAQKEAADYSEELAQFKANLAFPPELAGRLMRVDKETWRVLSEVIGLKRRIALQQLEVPTPEETREEFTDRCLGLRASLKTLSNIQTLPEQGEAIVLEWELVQAQARGDMPIDVEE